MANDDHDEAADATAVERPEVQRKGRVVRVRPVIHASVSPEVATALRAAAVGTGSTFSGVVDRVLRRALGLPELPHKAAGPQERRGATSGSSGDAPPCGYCGRCGPMRPDAAGPRGAASG